MIGCRVSNTANNQLRITEMLTSINFKKSGTKVGVRNENATVAGIQNNMTFKLAQWATADAFAV